MWPIKCLQFLDVAFGKNPYPGAAERGQLVIECNRLLGKYHSTYIIQPTQIPLVKTLVLKVFKSLILNSGDENRTVEINECHVANWFRNRRKMKQVIYQSGPKCKPKCSSIIL